MPIMVDLEEEVGLAEAIFDNEAEWPDELVFNRGDILHVLDQQPAGGLADGWWLCADKQGRRGIAPANRLKMIHMFGQDRDKVITPRRFGDVFLYNHRLFDDSNDTFFRQPPLGSLFSSVYDVPTALRNLYLLHGSDHPFLLADKIGNVGSQSHDNLLKSASGAANNLERRQPVVRNVPIKLEGRMESNNGITASDNATTLAPSSNIGNIHRTRSPPPPPPQRRHFNLSGPLLLSSLVTVPTTSSTSSSGSDEEKVVLSSGGSGQASPNSMVIAKDDARIKAEKAITELSLSLAASDIHQSQGSIYDKPSSLLTSVSSIVSNSPSFVRPVDPVAVSVKNPAIEVPPLPSFKNSISKLDNQLLPSVPAQRERLGNGELRNGNVGKSNHLSNTYDIPRLLRPELDDILKASTSTSVRRELLENEMAPVQGLRPAASSSTETDPERLSISSMDSKCSDYQELLSGNSELRLSAAVAMDTLMKLLQNLQKAVDSLNAYSVRNWRRRDYLESHIVDIRSSCRQVISALKDFFDFSSGAFVNVNKIVLSSATIDRTNVCGIDSANGRLAKHLAHLVRPLGDSLRLLIKLQQAIDISGWIVNKFVREGPGNDSLDQFLAVAKQVPHDARQVASFIHGNISSIFPISLLSSIVSPLSLPVATNGSGSVSSSDPLEQSPQEQQQTATTYLPRTVRFARDVQLSTGEIAPINGGDMNGPSNGMMNEMVNDKEEKLVESKGDSGFDDYDFVDGPAVSPPSHTDNPSDANISMNGTSGAVSVLSAEDKKILQFYSPQVENHIACLSNAIDDFLLAVEQNQPPKIFVGHSKFVILGAHDLVVFGDSIAQCVQRRELGEKVKQCADHLCEVLKYCVTATKQAAMQYPSVPCVQAMVDSMVNVSHAAYELKLLIQEAANL